MVVTQQITVQ